MKMFTAIAVAASFLGAPLALAHGDQPHAQCKKGWIMTEDHKCVKKT